MQALILTAGLGTRLRPLTFVRAKAAVPVNGEPIVRRVISWLVAQGLSDLVLNLHHCPESIAAAVGDGRDLGARVRYSWENPVLGSAGGPRHALPLLTDLDGTKAGQSESSFVLVNGDTLTDLRLDEMIDVHRSSGALVTMALIPNPRPDVYGGVTIDEDGGHVTGFTRAGSGDASFHFIGIQIAHHRVFASLEDGVPAESVMQLYPQLISENPAAIAAHVVNAAFKDVGTPADYWETSLEMAGVEGHRLVSKADVSIDPSADVDRTAVWDRVHIGAHARLKDCIVCDGVHLAAGSRFTRCAIVPYRGETLRADEQVVKGLVIKRF